MAGIGLSDAFIKVCCAPNSFGIFGKIESIGCWAAVIGDNKFHD